MKNKNHIPVENHSDLVRDKDTHAILNVNLSAYEAYKRGRSAQQQRDREFQQMKDEVNELKVMLKMVLDKLS